MEELESIERNPLRYWLWGALISGAVGAVQMGISLLVCMANYPASRIAEDEGYFLSDLGRSILPLAWLFNGSLILMGCSLIPMFIMLIVVDTRESVSLRVAAAFGILSALGLIGLGFSPVDRAYIWHMLFMATWVFPMLYMVIAFFFSASRSHYMNVWFVGASFLMAVGMLIVFWQSSSTDLKLIQRMLVVCGGIWLIFILWYLGVSGYSAIVEWEPDAQERQDRESVAYVQTLRQKKSTHA